MPLPQDKAHQAYGSTVGQAGHATGGQAGHATGGGMGGVGAPHLGGEHAVKDYNAQVLDALKAGAQPTTVGATTQHVRTASEVFEYMTALQKSEKEMKALGLLGVIGSACSSVLCTLRLLMKVLRASSQKCCWLQTLMQGQACAS